MRAGHDLPSLLTVPVSTDKSLPDLSLKRKFSSLLASRRSRQFSYPSPPMSRQPSPSQAGQQLPRNASSDVHDTGRVSRTSAANIGPAPISTGPPLLEPPQSAATSVREPYAGASLPEPFVYQTVPSEPSIAALPTAAIALTLTAQPSQRGGRRPKAHVASACVNCKRAHLSCDAKRPCERCVVTGKQETCYDVQHKKRGRPRLREEGSFKVEQLATERASESRLPATPIASSSRPIATPRHRRTDSSRSLRSQTAEGSAIQPSSYSSGPNFRPSQYYPQPPPVQLPPGDIPTAFLDIDLMLVRANGPFQQLICQGQNFTGRRIEDFIIPADENSLESIRTRLKAERDTREPSYLPPISSRNQELTPGISEVDVDRLTHGFQDREYSWRTYQRAPFPARVRLGKGQSYFVVVTLPTFYPTDPLAVPRQPTSSPYAPYPFHRPGGSPGPPPSQTYPSGPPHYAPTQWQPPYQRSIAPWTPRLLPHEPPIQNIPHDRRASAGELIPPFGFGAHLPPVARSPAPPAASPTQNVPGQRRRRSSSDDREQRSLKRRRRMSIGDVLQRSSPPD